MQSSVTYRQGVVLVVAAAFLWSLMGLFIRLIGDAGTWQVLFYRSLGMIPVLYIAIAIRSGGRPVAAMWRMGAAGLVGGLGLLVPFAAALFAAFSAVQSGSSGPALATAAVAASSAPTIQFNDVGFMIESSSSSDVHSPGVYQIGEVQPRSCCVIGTSGDILIPKRTWS